MLLRSAFVILASVLSVSAMAAAPTNKSIDPFKLVSTYGESDTHAVRWPDGLVHVYDTTNYSFIDQVIETLNRDLGDTKLIKSLTPDKAQIIIKSGETGSECGMTSVFTQRMTRTLNGAEIVLNQSGRCLGNTMGFAMYLHEMAHAVGMARHMISPNGLMDKTISGNADIKVTQEFRVFLQALYSIPAGTAIPDRSEDMVIDKLDTVALYHVLPDQVRRAPALASTDTSRFGVEPGVDVVAESGLTTIQDNQVAMVDATKESGLLPMPSQGTKAEAKRALKEDKKKPIIEFSPASHFVIEFGRDSDGRPASVMPGLVILDEVGNPVSTSVTSSSQRAVSPRPAKSARGNEAGLFIVQ